MATNLKLESSPHNIRPAFLTRWQSLRPHLVALAFYSLLTLFFAWPVITNLTVGTPGNFPVDRNQNLWNFWWFKRSLLETQTNPYNTDFLFFPYGAKLYLHTFSPYNLILGLPLQLIFGLIPTYGFIELLTFPLGGYGAYLLARYLSKSEWGGLLAGLVWSFGPYHYVELRQEQLNLLSLQWIPFFILFIFKLEKAQTRREILTNGLAAAFFYFLTIMVDYYYAIYLIMFAGLYWLWRLGSEIEGRKSKIENRRSRAGNQELGERLETEDRRRKTEKTDLLSGFRFSIFDFRLRKSALFLKLVGAIALGMLPYTPVLWATIRETGNPRYVPLDNTSTDQIHSTDLLKLFLPPAHHPWWGDKADFWKGWVGEASGGQLLNNWGSVLGYIAVMLAVYALFKVSGLWFWVFNGLFWLIISFGPTLRFNGESTGLAMPYRLLIKLPFIGIGRFPERFILITQLSIGILAAYGLAAWLRRLPERTHLGQSALKLPTRFLVGSLILILFFIESWPGILPPPKPLVAPPFTAVIAARNAEAVVPAGRAIFELPVTKHSNPDSPRMFYQIYHQRPITGGYISRDLIDPHRTANDYILYDWLEPRSLNNDIVPPKTQRDQLGLLDYAGMGYVVVYPAEITRQSDRERFQALLNLTFGGSPTGGSPTGGSPTGGSPTGGSPTTKALPFFQDDTAQVYLVPPSPLQNPVMVLGQGWDGPEPVSGGGVQRWIFQSATEARLNIAVGPQTPRPTSYNLEIKAVSPDKPRRLQILLNGQLVGDTRVGGISIIRLENLKLETGDNIVALRPDPADGFYVAPNDSRKLRIGVLSIKLI